MDNSAPVLFEDFHALDPMRRRGLVERLKDAMLALPEECHSPIAPTNHFGGGVNAREFFLAAGDVVVGQIHLRENIFMCIQGECTVYTEDGTFDVKAPLIAVTPAGAQRTILAHSDCIFVSLFAVGDERDEDKIEAMVATKDWNDPRLPESVRVLEIEP